MEGMTNGRSDSTASCGRDADGADRRPDDTEAGPVQGFDSAAADYPAGFFHAADGNVVCSCNADLRQGVREPRRVSDTEGNCWPVQLHGKLGQRDGNGVVSLGRWSFPEATGCSVHAAGAGDDGQPARFDRAGRSPEHSGVAADVTRWTGEGVLHGDTVGTAVGSVGP